MDKLWKAELELALIQWRAKATLCRVEADTVKYVINSMDSLLQQLKTSCKVKQDICRDILET